MQIPLSPSLEILRQACERFGYNFEIIDDFSQYLVEISDGKNHFFSGIAKLSIFPLNSVNAQKICVDKTHTKNLLQKKGFRVPQGNYFFIKEGRRSQNNIGKKMHDALNFAKKLGYPVFVKPNSATHGILCDIARNGKELKESLEKIGTRDYIALIEEVMEGNEYRIFALDGDVQYVYRRSHPILIGDGEHSINYLLKQFNDSVPDEKNKINKNNTFLKTQMEKNNWTINTILKNKEKFILAPKSNICAGGSIQDYQETVSIKTAEWVKKISNVFGLRIMGIDLFATDINNPETFTTLEVNSNPALTGIWNLGHKEKVFSIWEKIFNKYFKVESQKL